MKNLYDCIKEETDAGRTQEALRLADEALQHNEDDATLHYLKGCAYMKTAQWGEALNSLMRAEALDKESPAAEARALVTEILNFYHKDLYNP